MKTLAAVLFLVVGLSLQACTYVPAVEPTDLTVVEERAAAREEIEAVLGEPLKSKNTFEGSVNVYLYDRGAEGGVDSPFPSGTFRGCDENCLLLAILLQPIAWASTPFLYADKVDEQEGYLVIVYSADNTVIRYRRVTTEGEINQVISHEVEQAQLKMRAKDGDPDAMYEYAHRLQFGAGLERIKWYCLAAHAGHANAGYQFGRYHHDGYEIEKDEVQAHVWYSLSLEAKDSREVAKQRERLKAEMSFDEVAEAERLMAEWKPNPVECYRGTIIGEPGASAALSGSPSKALREEPIPATSSSSVETRLLGSTEVMATREAGKEEGHPSDGMWTGKAVIMDQWCVGGAKRFDLTLIVENGQVRGGDTDGIYVADGQVSENGRLEEASLNNYLLMEGSVARGILRLHNRDCGAHYALKKTDTQ